MTAKRNFKVGETYLLHLDGSTVHKDFTGWEVNNTPVVVIADDKISITVSSKLRILIIDNSHLNCLLPMSREVEILYGV